MIKISSHTYTPTSGTGPFTYQWTTPNLCVYFDKPNGTVQSGESFVTNIYVKDLTCFQFGVATVTLTLIDANGCQTNHTIYPTSPCDSLTISNIGQGPNEYDFGVSASGGDGNYKFDWSIQPDNLFAITNLSSVSSLYSYIHITPIGVWPKKPSFFDIICTVTDFNGCKDTVKKRFPLAGVNLANIVSESSCIEEGNSVPSGLTAFGQKGNLLTKAVQAGPILLSAESYAPGCEPDWSTIVFNLPDTEIQVKLYDDPIAVTFYGIKKTLFKDGILNIPFSVLDCKGVNSNEAYITILESSCSDGTSSCPLIVNNLCITNCDAVFTINLEDLIKSPDCCSTNSIDWTTFDILPGAPKLPATVQYNAGNHTITYTANGSVEIADLIRWGIKDALGNYSGIKTIQIARLCPAPPACVDDCYYVSQNAINHPLSVLANDLGPNLKLDTLIISQIPTHGTAYVLDGDIYYTPFNDYEGVDTLKYKIYNYDGLYCEATVTLNIAENGPAGTGNNIITCTTPIELFSSVSIPKQVSNAGEFDIIFKAYSGDYDPLEDGDELDVEIFVEGVEIASATLIIGQDYTTLAGVKVGTDDEWLTGGNFSQFLTPAILNKSTLSTMLGQTIVFDKHAWAWDTGNTNSYADPHEGGTTVITGAKEIEVHMKARSIATGTETLSTFDTVPKIKIFAFEDTMHVAGSQTNNAGSWSTVSGTFTPGYAEVPSVAGCTGTAVVSYFSSESLNQLDDLIGHYDPTGSYNVCGTKTIVEYSKGGIVYTVSDPFVHTKMTVPNLQDLINGYGSWTGDHIDWDYWTSSTNDYGLWGHNATYYNSNYLVGSLTDEPVLDYFIIEYTGIGGFNVGTKVKCTTVSHILF